MLFFKWRHHHLSRSRAGWRQNTQTQFAKSSRASVLSMVTSCALTRALIQKRTFKKRKSSEIASVLILKDEWR